MITGGVLSGIGKGVIASSTGLILKSYGFRVTSIKIDPYLNIDAGTMSPFEHGEVYVLDDGGEVDLDLGNYERFVDITLKRDNNITTGKIYQSVIEKEREGKYLGKTVQVIPHICNEIQDWIQRVSKLPSDGKEGEPDFCIIELGGTVGDIEHMPFTEAMRQFQFRVGKENLCVVHVSLVPVIGVVGEQKTKPTQQSIRELRALGLTPDIICCRSSKPIEQETKEKLANFCHVKPQFITGVHDVSNLYRVPLLLVDQGYANNILSSLNVTPAIPLELNDWKKLATLVDTLNTLKTEVRIVMVGKYTGLTDSYLSVIKGLNHASHYVGNKLVIDWVAASHLEPSAKEKHPEKYEEAWKKLKSANGILVPGGFGGRGVEGKILAANFARVNKIPYFGICLGLQIAVIEYARNVLGWSHATSEEFLSEEEKKVEEKDPHQCVVVFMPEISKTHMGGTMRLGARETVFKGTDNLSSLLYKRITGNVTSVSERHRHRYEVNPKVVNELEANGLRFVGQDETGMRQEILELPSHPFFLAVQYHPEFKSRPMKPSPPFVGFMLAASGYLQEWQQTDPWISKHSN
uniref:CTP synthase n=1 Tax=Arcella intermedia TaxID=1963864 RepID=A0A6B2L0P1_9EUKA